MSLIISHVTLKHPAPIGSGRGGISGNNCKERRQSSVRPVPPNLLLLVKETLTKPIIYLQRKPEDPHMFQFRGSRQTPLLFSGSLMTNRIHKIKYTLPDRDPTEHLPALLGTKRSYVHGSFHLQTFQMVSPVPEGQQASQLPVGLVSGGKTIYMTACWLKENQSFTCNDTSHRSHLHAARVGMGTDWY